MEEKKERGGARINAGKPKGRLNNKTIERLQAAQVEVERVLDNAMAGRQELGKAALERYMKIAEGVAQTFNPVIAVVDDAGKPVMDEKTGKQKIIPAARDHPAWPAFGQWLDRAIHCAVHLTKYQSPTFKAIAVHAPMELPPPQRVEPLTINEHGENVTPMVTSKNAMRVYEQLIMSVELKQSRR